TAYQPWSPIASVQRSTSADVIEASTYGPGSGARYAHGRGSAGSGEAPTFCTTLAPSPSIRSPTAGTSPSRSSRRYPAGDHHISTCPVMRASGQVRVPHAAVVGVALHGPLAGGADRP